MSAFGVRVFFILRMASLNCRCHQVAHNPPAVKLNRGTPFLVGRSNAFEANVFLYHLIFFLV
jgi:hypothetical protein